MHLGTGEPLKWTETKGELVFEVYHRDTSLLGAYHRNQNIIGRAAIPIRDLVEGGGGSADGLPSLPARTTRSSGEGGGGGTAGFYTGVCIGAIVNTELNGSKRFHLKSHVKQYDAHL